MEKGSDKNRIWEIDVLRGIALILMVIFHVVFDLKDIYGYPINYSSGFYYYVGKASAILFMLVSGISSSFSRSNIKRGGKIFALAMGVTLATYLFSPSLIVKFGVLHFFGVSMILYPLFKDFKGYMLIIIGTLVIIAGNFMSGVTVTSEFLFPLGLMSRNFMSSDYYPLFPWFGVFLYGAALGKILYKEKKSLFNFTIKDNPLMFISRHTLIVYVLHQPLTLLVLNLIMK